MMQPVEAGRERLKTGCIIDLCRAHAWDAPDPVEEIIRDLIYSQAEQPRTNRKIQENKRKFVFVFVCENK